MAKRSEAKRTKSGVVYRGKNTRSINQRDIQEKANTKTVLAKKEIK